MDDAEQFPSPTGKIIFLGTPDFAVASLDALIEAGYHIAGVVTAPDKPAGRGMKRTESAVKKYAVEKGLYLLQPEKLKDPLFIEALKTLQADIQIVVAFRMLPEMVWNMPPMGTINLHGSLLPQYRGAAPINWAVINGEKETGVTTFKLQHEIDTGNILLQESFPIGEDETAGEVHDRMKAIGAALLVKTVNGIYAGTLKEQPQSAGVSREASDVRRQSSSDMNCQSPVTDLPTASHDSRLTAHELKRAPKIFTETCRIDWTKQVAEIYNLIRGLSPFPAAFTYLNDKMLKIYKSKKELASPSIAAGTFVTDNKTYLKFAAADGYISVTEIQLEGKKKMVVDEFLRGYRF